MKHYSLTYFYGYLYRVVLGRMLNACDLTLLKCQETKPKVITVFPNECLMMKMFLEVKAAGSLRRPESERFV